MRSSAAGASISDADLEKVRDFTREPIVLEGEDLEALAPGTARRRAFDAALSELETGAESPSPEWRREYSLMLGLERLLWDEEPKLVDGTVLSAHQVDALSGINGIHDCIYEAAPPVFSLIGAGARRRNRNIIATIPNTVKTPAIRTIFITTAPYFPVAGS